MADGLEPRISSLEVRVAVVDQIAADTRSGLDRIEKQLEALGGRIEKQLGDMGNRLDRMDVRLDRMDLRLDAMESGHRADFHWLVGVVLGSLATTLGAYAGLLGVMAHGFHWL